MKRHSLLFIILAAAAILPGCECSDSSRNKCGDPGTIAACASLKSLYTANKAFKILMAGQSEVFEIKYYGYCKQTIDLCDAELETDQGIQKIHGIDKFLCAAEGENGNSGGYYYRYLVTQTSKKADGLDDVSGYMIVAWPETVGKTGRWTYIINEQGTIYYRDATQDDQGENSPVKKWPDVDADGSEWKRIAG